ncbi:MAG: C69 family dipeptidase [Bacteroidales bacterium]|nr:C69 family dipeptidase [Bacteroidales bacterium]
MVATFTLTFVLLSAATFACTNYLITKGASTDGSVMISYAADSHTLYGELYHWPAADYPKGAKLKIYEWDTGKFLGEINQIAHTYAVIGNMNEHQLAIGETTYGGVDTLANYNSGIIDYGSLIYITLQRAKNAREAIKIMGELVEEYGYYSSGESFSIADKDEVWILEMIGKGKDKKGAVWVALKIPDGYVSGHANQARITTFPLENGKTSISSKNLSKVFQPEIECVYAHDVISFAKELKLFSGKDKEFSFSDTYAPVKFGGARFCEVRVWSMFRKVNKDMDKYLEYVKGHDLKNRMPLWIKPDRKISPKDMFDFMRDHLEGTPLDMTKDMGAGPWENPYRWRPLTWKVDGKEYCHERATATQQTGFSFVAQSRNWLPNPIGGIFWFSVDDAASTVYFPMYCGSTEIPWSFAVGNGDMMTYSKQAAFWVFNEVCNLAYTRYNMIHPEIKEKIDNYENKYLKTIKAVDKAADELYKEDKNLGIEYITNYSVNTGNKLTKDWRSFYEYLFVKYMDGNVKEKIETPADHKYIPPKVKFPGYGEDWQRRVVKETGEHFLVPEGGH